MGEPPRGATLSAERQREALRVSRMGIGARLCRVLNDTVSEPVPGEWMVLLSAADARASGEQPQNAPKRRFS